MTAAVGAVRGVLADGQARELHLRLFLLIRAAGGDAEIVSYRRIGTAGLASRKRTRRCRSRAAMITSASAPVCSSVMGCSQVRRGRISARCISEPVEGYRMVGQPPSTGAVSHVRSAWYIRTIYMEWSNRMH